MKDKKALIALIITVLIWGSSFVAIKIVLDQITPLALSFLRSGVATLGSLKRKIFILCFARGNRSYSI